MQADEKKISVFAAAAVAAIAVLLVLMALRGRPGGRPEQNPYPYDLSRFSGTGNAPTPYVEIARVKPDLRTLRGVALDAATNIFIAGDTAVEVRDMGGALVRRFELDAAPSCIAVSAGGDTFVGLAGHVEVRDAAGARKAVWESMGEQAVLTSIAVAEGGVCAADAGNRVVWCFDWDGRLRGRIDGGSGAGADGRGFVVPSAYFDLAAAADGTLWVVNPGIQQVQNYTPAGRLVRAWGKSSADIDGFIGCCNPSHLALAPGGSFVTSEKGLPRVKVYGPDGTLAAVVAAPASFANGTVGLDLACDSSGRVFVLDPAAGAVRIFERPQAQAGEGAKR